MALITCPHCGGVISDTAAKCPHCSSVLSKIVADYVICPECGNQVADDVNYCPNCGYRMVTTAASIVSPTISVNTTTVKRNGYDVMLVDYNRSRSTINSALRNILDISYTDASKLLNQLPCYLYNDITQDDAEYIARACQNKGMRVAVYDPLGNVKYYTPINYNITLPTLINIQRRPLFTIVPRRKPSILNIIGNSIFSPIRQPRFYTRNVYQIPPQRRYDAPKKTIDNRTNVRINNQPGLGTGVSRNTNKSKNIFEKPVNSDKRGRR